MVCRNAICCVIFTLGMICTVSIVVLVCYGGGIFVLDGWGLTFHSGFVVVLVPYSTTLLSFMITMIDLSIKLVHPRSYRKLMDSRAPEGNNGKMCAFHPTGGSEGRRIFAGVQRLDCNAIWHLNRYWCCYYFSMNMWGVDEYIIFRCPAFVANAIFLFVVVV